MELEKRLLVLKKGEDLSLKVFRLRKGWKLYFACEPLLTSHNVRLFCNYPTGTPGQNEKYSELYFMRNDCYIDGYSLISKEITLLVPGPFHYFFTTDNSDLVTNANGQGFFIVDPELSYGKDNKMLQLDGIQLHTVLPKLLGPFDEWKDRLEVSYRCGYNMIHFTPLQQLNGESNSSYSISDQLVINPSFSKDTNCDWDDIETLVRFMNREWNVLAVTDMVYNHTANDSDWIVAYPESAYNLSNSPHLKPAYLLDRAIMYASQKIATASMEPKIPAKISSMAHINELRSYLHEEISEVKIEEFYLLNTKQITHQFSLALGEILKGLRECNAVEYLSTKQGSYPQIVQDSHYRRLHSTIDIENAINYLSSPLGALLQERTDEGTIIEKVSSQLHEILVQLNKQKAIEVDTHKNSAIENILKGVQYRFIESYGPKIDRVSSEEPLVYQYFTNKGQSTLDIVDDDRLISDKQRCSLVMAHNGWVMNDDPMRDFAKPGSYVYLRRELVVWGDSIKLRYGEKPSDSPDVWNRMEEYTRRSVKIFDGIRLDNCHSTPIHVAEHMMKLARAIRPDLYVIAELFTSHEDIDNIFVNRLGLNSLIREGLSAWDAHEQGRLVYKYGGYPVGSFFQHKCQIMRPSVAHALFMDATHDNDSIVTKRTALDSVALSAYVAMSSCATGSNRGYDELVPYHINVVSETRLYQSWTEEQDAGPGYCNASSGMLSIKTSLNELHHNMGNNGFDQVYVHDLSSEVVSITRHNPITHETNICVVRSSFHHHSNHHHCDDLVFEGVLKDVLLYARLNAIEHVKSVETDQQSDYLTGLSSYEPVCLVSQPIQEIPGISYHVVDGGRQVISFKQIPPGTVLILRVLPQPGLVQTREKIIENVELIKSYVTGDSSSSRSMKLYDLLQNLTLKDLNAVLFHCEREELSTSGFGAYVIPNYGPLVYTGLQGVITVLTKISESNDLGHALCHNLRSGDWLMVYIVDRLKKYPALTQFADFVSELFKPIQDLPRYLIPSYFELMFVSLSTLLNHTVLQKINSRFVKEGTPLVKELVLCSQQFCGVQKTASLAPLMASLLHSESAPISIAAGLPHFSEGIMRIWGRDTFIALRGLLLVTGRFSEAKLIILSFAGTLRHGLIPNLLGEGKHARYNCRDAVWWWLQAIQDYYKLAPDGKELLQETVTRMYPKDGSLPHEPGEATQPLHDTMQEALQRHAQGTVFRERNAGRTIDEHMSDEGFNLEIGIDWNTGFVVGGNASNCGTWMDKMGSSGKAGNKGKPATPRNGSAVELVCLCASTVKWLANLSKTSIYPYSGVIGKRPNWEEALEIPFDVWYNLILKNFEKYFWVDGTFSTLEPEHNPKLINRKNIYKDSVGATPDWADYQLRPNFPIGIVVAPELFKPEHALAALDMVEKHLSGPLGLKTLDPSDWNYRGDYVNSDDTNDFNTAAGFNYHQGPEWLWVFGYYLRARLTVANILESGKPGMIAKTKSLIHEKLALHHYTLCTSEWRSLPELTNSNGKVCRDSCPAQAWSISCLLDVLFDIFSIDDAKLK